MKFLSRLFKKALIDSTVAYEIELLLKEMPPMSTYKELRSVIGDIAYLKLLKFQNNRIYDGHDIKLKWLVDESGVWESSHQAISPFQYLKEVINFPVAIVDEPETVLETQIKMVIRDRFNNYKGPYYSYLKEIHDLVRKRVGDYEFLNFLNSYNATIKPYYDLPDDFFINTQMPKHELLHFINKTYSPKG